MAKVYLRFLDGDNPETCKVKLISDPPKSEWEEGNLTPAQTLALVAMGACLDHSKVMSVDRAEPEDKPDSITVRSDDIGNN
jgi:hypothetical protein